MGYFIAMYVCNLLLPVIIVIAGCFMSKRIPKNRNGFFGYRTKMSMLTDETWKFAHKTCGRLWKKTGLILLVPSALVQLPFSGSGEDTVGVLSLILEFVQAFVIIATIIMVEKELKRNFDEFGNRKNKN